MFPLRRIDPGNVEREHHYFHIEVLDEHIVETLDAEDRTVFIWLYQDVSQIVRNLLGLAWQRGYLALEQMQNRLMRVDCHDWTKEQW